MPQVYIAGSNIISPLGTTTAENYTKVVAGETGVRMIDDENIYGHPFPGAMLNWEKFNQKTADLNDYTKLERMFISSIREAMERCRVKPDCSSALLILSSTKGNIDLLKSKGDIEKGVLLYEMTKKIAVHFGFEKQPLMVSNACISGVLAISMAARMIREGLVSSVIVSGGDLISEFVVSGFNSLMAISPGLCRPFDANREGINLGEACATVILTKEMTDIEVLPGFSSNDANHISGPSRTGDGLLSAINKTLQFNNLAADSIDFISAHGTATSFNDDMESKAFFQAEMADIPLNSLKGFFGHTLGAAGVLESIITLESMRDNTMIRSLGFEFPGTAHELNVLKSNVSKVFNTVLKTASGFGGCNAAVIYRKD